MAAAETDLAAALRHLAEVEEHIAQHKELIARLVAKGQDTSRAENTLRQMEYSLALAQRQVRRLREKTDLAQ